MQARLAEVLTLAVAALVLPSCRNATAVVDEPPKTVVVDPAPSPRAPPSDGELGLGVGLGEGAAPIWQPGQPMPEIGAPCTARTTAAPAPNVPPDPCGTKGRVAMRWDDHSTTGAFAPKEEGCKLVEIDKNVKGKTFTTNPRSACAKDGRIWAMAPCEICRALYSGWAATGLVAEMTPAQTLALQEKLGLGSSALLTTTEAWTKAILAAAG
jgi:hypothetical protein